MRNTRREIWVIMADGKNILPLTQGGIMATALLQNVRTFPTRQEISPIDNFLIRYGAKEMTLPKKETEGATAIKWNQSVLSLVATLLVILGILVGFIWNYAVLSTKFDLQQQKINQLESDQRDLKNDINRFKEFQLKTDAYKLGAADVHNAEKEKK